MKNDPIIRMLLIVILGTIAFGLLFNTFTGGGNNMDDMMNASSNMLNSGTSIDVFLSSLFVLLIKFLMIVLVVAIVIGVVMWIKNNFFKDINITQKMNQDPMTKKAVGITVIVIGALLVLWVFNNLINPGMGYTSTGMGYNSTGMGYMNGTSGYGLNVSLGFTSVLSLLIKVLSYVFVISLILGLVAYLKKMYEAGSFNFMKTTINTTGTNQTVNTPTDVPQANDLNKTE